MVRKKTRPTQVHQDRTRYARNSKHPTLVSESVENFNTLFAPGDLVISALLKFNHKEARIHRIVAVEYQARNFTVSDGEEMVYLTEVHFLNYEDPIGLRTYTTRNMDRNYRKLTPVEELLYGPRIRSSTQR